MRLFILRVAPAFCQDAELLLLLTRLSWHDVTCQALLKAGSPEEALAYIRAAEARKNWEPRGDRSGDNRPQPRTLRELLSPAGERAELPIYHPPSVGWSFDDSWAKDSEGAWNLFRFPNGNPPGDFAARVMAVPEAGPLAYGLLGGLLVLVGRLRFCALRLLICRPSWKQETSGPSTPPFR